MSCQIQIFISTDETGLNLIEFIEGALNVSLQLVDDGSCVIAELKDDKHSFTVLSHTFVNDWDMMFEDYDYYVSVNGCQETKLEYAKHIFNALKETARYRLMLTKDVQRKLDEYDPRNAK